MAKVKNGAELVKRLKATGTPDQRLAPARDVLAKVHAEQNKVANSDQVIMALEARFGPDHMTCVKARAIAATGDWNPPVNQTPVRAIEDELLGDATAEVSIAAPESAPVRKPTKRMKAIQTTKVQDVVEVS